MLVKWMKVGFECEPGAADVSSIGVNCRFWIQLAAVIDC